MIQRGSSPLPFLLLAGALAAPAHGQKHLDEATVLRAERAERAPEPRPAERGPRAAGPGNPLFHFVGSDNAECVRSVTDVNGDGRQDLIVGIGVSGENNVFCLSGASSGAASVLWGYQTADGVSGGSPYGDQSIVPISDVEGNLRQNLLLGTAWGGRTAYQFDSGLGLPQWKFDTYLEAGGETGWVYSLCEVDDVTGDGIPECAFGVGSTNDSVYLVDGATFGGGQATVLWRHRPGDVAYSVRNIGDVNGDGRDDVLAAIGDAVDELICLDSATSDPAGKVLWSYDPGVSLFACGVLPDVTGDGIAEALAVCWTTNGSAIRCRSGADGSHVWQSTQVFQYGEQVESIRDVTGDGKHDVLVASWENAVIVLDGADGSLVWKTTVGTVNGGDVWTLRAIDDLNGDGRQDVIAGSFDYHVYALDGDSGEIFWAFDTGNRVFSVYPIGDLNGDGKPEVAAGTQDTTSSTVVHVLEGDAGIPSPNLSLAGTFAIGSPLEIEITGQPATIAVPALSTATTSFMVKNFTGLLGIAPPFIVLQAGVIPFGRGYVLQTAIPNQPSLIGLVVFAQGISGLPNPLRGAFTDVESFVIQ